jgi:hypothetical protein
MNDSILMGSTLTVPQQTLSTWKKLWTDPETFATTLLVMGLDHYGPELLTWHPETIRLEIESDFALKLPKANYDRLLAAITVVTTDLFFKNASRFVQLANVLAFDDFQPDEFDPADAMECAWAITEALLLSPPDEDDELFCLEIRRYIAFILDEQGFVQAPDVLRLAVKDYAKTVSYDFTDDPEMFAAVNDVQTGKKDAVETTLRLCLYELMEQLSALKLKQGSTDEIVKKLQQLLRKGVTS